MFILFYCYLFLQLRSLTTQVCQYLFHIMDNTIKRSAALELGATAQQKLEVDSVYNNQLFTNEDQLNLNIMGFCGIVCSQLHIIRIVAATLVNFVPNNYASDVPICVNSDDSDVCSI